MSKRQAEQLILLVGSNPLPNFLATSVLKPKSVQLVYSPETEQVKSSLEEKLKAKYVDLSLSEKCVMDATNASEVRAALNKIPDGAHLHYTGGTKIMAAHARMAFRDAGGKDEHASYINEREGILRFDDGYDIRLSNESLGLTIEDIFELHGIRVKNSDSQRDSDSQNYPTSEDSEKIAQAVIKNPDLANELYNLHREQDKRKSIEKARNNPAKLDELIPGGLSARQIPEEGWTKDAYKKWCDFLGGGWLERWCGDLVRSIVPDAELAVGLNCKMANERQFEIDVALVRGHRLYVISCTTHTTIGMCKSKLFEVAMRARQLGGDLARSALVCLLHGSDNKGVLKIDHLRNDVADVWEAANTPKVFGLDDVREWMGDGGRPDTDSLKKWLDS